MFDYLEPDANDNPEAGSLPLPPSGANSTGNRPPTPEKVRHLLYGSRAAIDRTIKILHAYGYADPNDWSDPIPVPPSGMAGAAPERLPDGAPAGTTWMVVLTKTLLLE